MAEAVVKKLDVPERIPILFPLGDQLIDSAIVRPLLFQGFVDCVNEAQAMTSPTTFEARLKRCKMMKQVVFYVGGAVVQVSAIDLLRLPIPAVRTLFAKLDADDTPAGKIIRKGDGVATAITYELGTPISVGQGKPPIKELEFLAATYGDIEDVLSAPSRLQQALLLLGGNAKPLNTSLTQLPSWAMGQITVADGFAITNEVVPLFLGSPDES